MAELTLDQLLTYAGSLVGLTTGVVAVVQYVRQRRWTRSQFAAALLMRLHEDEDLAFACKLLDWTSRNLRWPEHHRLSDDETVFPHRFERLRSAMRAHADTSRFERDEVVYRDVFDRFFTYLEEVEHFLSVDLISVADVKPLEYWLERVVQPGFVDDPVFTDFLTAYGYSDVQSLMARYGVEPGIKPVPNTPPGPDRAGEQPGGR